MNRSLSLLAIPLAAACVTSDPDLADQRQPVLGDCPALICGNTPMLGAHPVWELDQKGLDFSANGFRIKSVALGGVEYHFDVDGFELLGRPVAGGPPVDMVGAVATIESATNGLTYLLTVEPGLPVTYVENGDDGTVLSTHRFTYVAVDKQGRVSAPAGMCGTDPIDGSARDALVFRGDRYDKVTGELIATGEAAGSWFNIACRDDALWKLALFRHVEAAGDPFHVTTPDQRMAGLRSIRADYCGTGQALTELGVAVDWTNQGGWLTVAPDHVVESAWDESGAVCLDVPRLLSLDAIPCTLPRCTELPAPPADLGSFVTYVPAP